MRLHAYEIWDCTSCMRVYHFVQGPINIIYFASSVQYMHCEQCRKLILYHKWDRQAAHNISSVNNSKLSHKWDVRAAHNIRSVHNSKLIPRHKWDIITAVTERREQCQAVVPVSAWRVYTYERRTCHVPQTLQLAFKLRMSSGWERWHWKNKFYFIHENSCVICVYKLLCLVSFVVYIACSVT